MICSVAAKHVWPAAGRAHPDCITEAHWPQFRMNLLQVAQKPFRLTDDFVAPKGTLIMPSIVAANMQVGPLMCTPLFASILEGSRPWCEDVQPSCVVSCDCKLHSQSPAAHSSGWCERLLCWVCQCGSTWPLHLPDFTAFQGCGGCTMLNPSAA